MSSQEKTSKVYLVNDGQHDYSAAKKFGELCYMTKRFINKLQVTQIARTFEPFIKDSKPTDYILQGGPNVMLSIACAQFALRHGRLNLLVFKDDEYHKRTIVFERREDEDPTA